jgi:hypothetical protein
VVFINFFDANPKKEYKKDMFSAGFNFAAGVVGFIIVFILFIGFLRLWPLWLTALITFVLPFILAVIILLNFIPNSIFFVLIISFAFAVVIARKNFEKLFLRFSKDEDGDFRP